MIIVGALFVILVLCIDIFVSVKIANYFENKYEDWFGIAIIASIFVIIFMEVAILLQFLLVK